MNNSPLATPCGRLAGDDMSCQRIPTNDLLELRFWSCLVSRLVFNVVVSTVAHSKATRTSIVGSLCSACHLLPQNPTEDTISRIRYLWWSQSWSIWRCHIMYSVLGYQYALLLASHSLSAAEAHVVSFATLSATYLSHSSLSWRTWSYNAWLRTDLEQSTAAAQQCEVLLSSTPSSDTGCC